MDQRDTNPSANVPRQGDDEPLGDRGQGDTSWTPRAGEQGISNRPDDMESAPDDDEEDDFEDEDEDDQDEEEESDAEND